MITVSVLKKLDVIPRSVTETLNIRDVTSAIAGRKQLKHRSRLYDLPRSEDERNINDYNPVLLAAWEGNIRKYGYTIYWREVVTAYLVHY